ncbi:MAG: hypothetical protein ACOC4G_15215 [Bacillota bacterium]
MNTIIIYIISAIVAFMVKEYFGFYKISKHGLSWKKFLIDNGIFFIVFFLCALILHLLF